MESAVALQLQSHLSLNGLYPVFQSAYRRHHSTETALLKIKNDLLMTMNKQHVTLLVLLDLSSAFDTLNHDTLLNVLHSRFGIEGTALHWFDSYLSNRTQQVSICGTLSQKFNLVSGVPQGSCLGQLLFILYTSSLFEIIETQIPDFHCNADEVKLYLGYDE